jgi:hypothetical protein
VTRRQLSPSTASSDTSEEREEPVSPDSPTDRDLLLEILGRLRRIEKHFGILENTWEIGDRNGPPAPRGEQGPIEPLRRSKSKRVGKVPVPAPWTKVKPDKVTGSRARQVIGVLLIMRAWLPNASS